MLTLLLGFFILVMAGGAAFALLERRGRALPLKFSVSHGVAGGVAHGLLLVAGAGPSGQLSREPVHRGVHDHGLGRAPAVRLPRLQADLASGSGAVACRYRRG